MRKFETTFASFEKATNQLTILNPFFLPKEQENLIMHEREKDSVMLGSQQAAKHSHEDLLFFPAIFILQKAKLTL